MMDSAVLDVAFVGRRRYTGRMSKASNTDEVSIAEAMAILHIRNKPTFYDVVKRAKAEHGVNLQHYRFPLARRAYYLRSEMEALMRGDFDAIRREQGTSDASP